MSYNYENNSEYDDGNIPDIDKPKNTTSKNSIPNNEWEEKDCKKRKETEIEEL